MDASEALRLLHSGARWLCGEGTRALKASRLDTAGLLRLCDDDSRLFYQSMQVHGIIMLHMERSNYRLQKRTRYPYWYRYSQPIIIQYAACTGILVWYLNN